MRLNIIFCFFILIILGISCNNSEGTNSGNLNLESVDYYKLKDGIDLEALLVSNKDSLNANSQLLGDLSLGFIPQVIGDTTFLNSITNVGYAKIDVPQQKIEMIKDAFYKSKSYKGQERISNKCINKYRDILVLRDKNGITGVIKLCFSCEDFLIVESEENTLNMNFTFSELKELLHNL